MLDLFLHMWLTALVFLLLGYWARGYLNPSQRFDASAQNAVEVAAARTRLQRCDAERIRLNARVAEIEPRLESVQSRLDAASSRVAELEATRAPMATGDVAKLQARVKELEGELASAREQAREADKAREQLSATREELAAMKTAALSGGSDFRSVAAEPLVIEPLLDAPVHGAPDDLKRIKGVGPKLEEKLNAMGVFYLSQIASWTDENVAELDGQLPLPGRISRDKWVEQARLLSNLTQ